jgi:hypothetical protein
VDARGELGDGGRLKQGPQRQIGLASVVHLRQQGGTEQRVPTQGGEIVMDANGGDGRQGFPEGNELGF